MLRWIAATVGALALIAAAGLASVYPASEAGREVSDLYEFLHGMALRAVTAR